MTFSIFSSDSSTSSLARQQQTVDGQNKRSAPAFSRSGLWATTFLPRLLLGLAILFYAIYFSHLTLTRYFAFEARALDMGNLNQAIWNTAHGRWFHLTNQPGTVNRLSLHVEPILLPISWLYRLYPAPPVLLILQASVVALGALPLFTLARYKLQNEWIALLFALAFLLNPSIQAANWLEFHPVTLVPTFLMTAFYFLVTDRAGWYTLFALLAASCKEEVALLVFMVGLYGLVVERKKRLGILTMLLSLVWAGVAVFGIQNTFADGNIHWGRYGYLGETPGQMVRSLLTRPGLVWAQLGAADALGYLTQLLLPVGFLALLAPEILLLALPSLALNLLADFPPMHQVDTLIYAAPIVPFVLMGAVYGTARLVRFAERWGGRKGWVLAGVALLLLMTIGTAQRLYGYTPWGSNYQLFTITPHDRRAAAIIDQIPPAAAVSAQDKLNPHVSGRETIYIFPRIEDARTGDADTVFLDVTGPAWPLHPNDLHAEVQRLLAEGWGIAAAEDGYLLLRRDVETQTMPPAFYDVWRRPDYVPERPVQIDFGDGLRLINYQVGNDEHGEVVVEFYWQALRPLEDDLHFYVAFMDQDGAVLHDTQYYQPTPVLWYPTSVWEAGMPVRVTTLPWTAAGEQLAVVLGVYAGETGERLPVTSVEPVLPRLEGDTLVRLGGYARQDSGEWQPISPTVALADDGVPLGVRFGRGIDDENGNGRGDKIVLERAHMAESTAGPGGMLSFTLEWRTMEPVSFDYTVFAHLLNQDGEKVAQVDWQPQDEIGRLPMSSWIVGEAVVDTHVLPLPEDLSAGSYRLVVGVYDWQDGSRLPTLDEDDVADTVTIGTITVKD